MPEAKREDTPARREAILSFFHRASLLIWAWKRVYVRAVFFPPPPGGGKKTDSGTDATPLAKIQRHTLFHLALVRFLISIGILAVYSICVFYRSFLRALSIWASVIWRRRHTAFFSVFS